jgi:glyoxylase-like metal-dependent hydrolase (beta-lactamase superfamily II)
MTTQDSVSTVSLPQIDSRIHVFRRIFSLEPDQSDELQVDAYIITTSRYLIICDTMTRPEDAAMMLETLPEKVRSGSGRHTLIVNSHADWDHVWGNRFFVSSSQHHGSSPHTTYPIIAHTRCIQRLHSVAAQSELRDYQERTDLFHNVVLIPPTLTFDSHLTIDGGDLTLELFHAPGHCCDHIVGWLPAIHTLLAFDAVETPFPTVENQRGVADMFATLKHLQGLHPHHVLCSHGETTSPTIIQQNLSYLQEIEKRCRTFLVSGEPTEHELEQASDLISYPYETVLANAPHPAIIDHNYYRWAHEHNIRSIMQYLIS